MKLYAHRGYSSQYPENTMIAFQKAIEAGCDGIELDVQLTRDNIPVVIHDEKIDRTSTGKGYVKDLTYRELLSFDFSWDKPIPGERIHIPQLSEVLMLLRYAGRDITLNIELKNSVIDYRGLEEIVLAQTRDYEDLFPIIYSSFNHNSLRRLNKLDPHSNTALLVEHGIPDLPRYARSLGCKGVHPSILILDEEIIRNLLDQGQYVNVYTINDGPLGRRLAQNNVSGIITDYVAEMKEALLNGKEFSID